MSKGNNIKWRDKDIAELQRVARNFNAKIARIAKTNPSKAPFLPEKISVKDLKSKIGTRQDFKRELNSAKRFSRKGAEKVQTTPTGLTLTNYEINEAKIKTRIVNTKRTNELKKLDIDIKAGNMGQISSQNLKPKKFSLNKTAKEWDKFVESLEREIATNFKKDMVELYKTNYLEAIKNFLGEDGYDLHQYIQSMDAEHVYRNSINNPILSIGFTSDPLPTDMIVDHALNEWMEIE